MSGADKTLGVLLELDGTRYVIDETHGLWIKFDVKKVIPTSERPHGIKYSLTLHDRTSNRIMGFDNAHGIRNSDTYDHWHRYENNKSLSYHFINTGKLLEDFWFEVDKLIEKLEK